MGCAVLTSLSCGLCSRIARDCSRFRWNSVRSRAGTMLLKASIARSEGSIIPVFNTDGKYYTAGFLLACDQVLRRLMEALYLTKWHLRKGSVRPRGRQQAPSQHLSGRFLTDAVGSTAFQQQQILRLLPKSVRRLPNRTHSGYSAYPLRRTQVERHRVARQSLHSRTRQIVLRNAARFSQTACC